MKRRDLLTGCGTMAAMLMGNAVLWRPLGGGTTSSMEMLAESAECNPELLDLTQLDFLQPGFTDREQSMFLSQIVPFSHEQAQISDTSAPTPTVALENRQQEPKPVTTPPATADSMPTPEQLQAKVRNFNNDFSDDIFLPEDQIPLLHSVILRLKTIERKVGHGRFNLISFDETIKIAERFGDIAEFTTAEKNFMEEVFFADVRAYGFFGEKVTRELTAVFESKDAVKIPRSGHYLYSDISLAYYDQLKRDIGDSIILTSGIRSVVKQMTLFLAKTIQTKYNLSRASRSLAPPGHSYHGVGDFDVGRIGFGFANFTSKFAETDEFKRMQKLGYVKIRYAVNNQLGVRYEPWHIKVV